MTQSKDILNYMEIANLGHLIHGLGKGIKIHLMQPGDKKLPHGPRLKVFKGSLKTKNKEEFVLTIEKHPRIAAGKSFLNAVELKWVECFIIRNHDALISFWEDPDMTVDDLASRLKKVETAGEAIKRRRKELPKKQKCNMLIYSRTNNHQPYKCEVTGYVFTLRKEFNFFVFKEHRNKWVVCEYKTGVRLLSRSKMREAMMATAIGLATTGEDELRRELKEFTFDINSLPSISLIDARSLWSTKDSYEREYL